jgi:serine/threonine protein kinase
LVIDRISGLSLVKDLAKITPAQIRVIIHGIASGVHYLHVNGLIHRDLKPENVVLDSRGYPFVIDLGNSKLLSGAYHTGATGSLRYQAPENCVGEEYGFPADVYSLGITFWELICRSAWIVPPLPDGEFRRAVKRHNLRPPLDRHHLLPAQRTLLESMWNGNPNARPTIGKVLAELERPEMWDGCGVAEIAQYRVWLERETTTPIDPVLVPHVSDYTNQQAVVPETGKSFLEYVVDNLAYLSGDGTQLNNEVREEVLRQLGGGDCLDPMPFSGETGSSP